MSITPAPSSAARSLVLASFCLAAVIAYVQRVAISVPAARIRADFDLSQDQMAWILAAYYWAYAFGQIPAGWLAQKIGTRRLLPVSIALSSLCCAAASFAVTPQQFGAAWTLAGLTIAAIFPCCVQSIVRWFPADQRAFPSGALGSSMSIGGAISTALTGWLMVDWATAEWPAWRMIFFVYALPGLVWALAFPIWFRDQPAPTSNNGAPANAPDDEDHRWWQDPRTWLICGQQFLRAAGYVFYATWFPTYLRETRHVSTEQAGFLTSLPLLGVVAGGALGGFLIDLIDRRTRNRRISRQLVAIVCHGLCGLLVLTASWISDARLAVTIISLGSFVFAIGGACSYTITMDLGGRRAATLFAVMNTCGNLGAAACPIVVSRLVTHVGWDAILIFFAALYGGVALCWAFLDPRPR